MTSLDVRTPTIAIPWCKITLPFAVCLVTLVLAADCGAQVDDPLGDVDEKEVQPQQDVGPECLRPLVNAELSFVRRVCEVSDNQMAAIVVAAKDAHKAMAGVIKEDEPVVDGASDEHQVHFVTPDGEWLVVNPYKRVREDMAKLLKSLVTDQQYAMYAEEARARDEYERETTIEILIKLLDAKLVLSMAQREQLQEVFNTHLKVLELRWVEAYESISSIPPLPDHLFLSLLSDAQKKRLACESRDDHVIDIEGDEDAPGLSEEWIKE